MVQIKETNMNTIDVQVVLFKSWSDSFGNRRLVKRPGILVSIDGITKLIPVLSNNSDFFINSNSYFECTPEKFRLNTTSWLSFGYEVKWDRTKWAATIKKKVRVNLDELLEKRANYHKHSGIEEVRSPF